jgi:hypothetical protein
MGDMLPGALRAMIGAVWEVECGYLGPGVKPMMRVITIALTFLILALVFLYQPTLLSTGRPKPSPTPSPPAGQMRPYPSARAAHDLVLQAHPTQAVATGFTYLYDLPRE